jgi:hypothetical protein
MAVGSLSSAFASARHVRLAVKPAFPFTGPERFPSVLSRPLSSSVTFWAFGVHLIYSASRV